MGAPIVNHNNVRPISKRNTLEPSRTLLSFSVAVLEAPLLFPKDLTSSVCGRSIRKLDLGDFNGLLVEQRQGVEGDCEFLRQGGRLFPVPPFVGHDQAERPAKGGCGLREQRFPDLLGQGQLRQDIGCKWGKWGSNLYP